MSPTLNFDKKTKIPKDQKIQFLKIYKKEPETKQRVFLEDKKVQKKTIEYKNRSKVTLLLMSPTLNFDKKTKI